MFCNQAAKFRMLGFSTPLWPNSCPKYLKALKASTFGISFSLIVKLTLILEYQGDLYITVRCDDEVVGERHDGIALAVG
jgi:hypothetical protein